MTKLAAGALPPGHDPHAADADNSRSYDRPKKGAVLLVEDDVMVRLAAAEFLRDCSYRVVEARDAKEAIEILRSGERVDVVFSDVRMPGDINGFEFAAWVHANYPHMPVILASGYSDQKSLEAFQEFGTFMIKPYSYDALLENIERLMRRAIARGA